MVDLAKEMIPQTSLVYLFCKGALDRLIGLLILIIVSPLMLGITVLIRLDSSGSAIFRQERVGKDGHRFTLYKFRTMRIDNDETQYKEYLRRLINEGTPYKVDEQGNAFYKIIDDPRVTRFGAFLRETNLDELPQIINLLKGEMSFVGPRPDIPFAVEMYKDWHKKRLSVKPGMTGLWQVTGINRVPFDEMVRIDIDYIERCSLVLDSKILLMTALRVLRMDGSYKSQEGVRNG